MSKILCIHCNDVIESVHRHDYVSCTCRKESNRLSEEFLTLLNGYVEGGTKMSPHLAVCVFEELVGRGVSLDGGSDYTKVGGNLADYKFIEESNNEESI